MGLIGWEYFCSAKPSVLQEGQSISELYVRLGCFNVAQVF